MLFFFFLRDLFCISELLWLVGRIKRSHMSNTARRLDIPHPWYKVNMPNIPLRCDYGTLCSHTPIGQCLMYILPPVACQLTLNSQSPKKGYWLGVSGVHTVYLLSSAAHNLRVGADKPEGPLCQFLTLSLSSTRITIQEGSSCCETLSRLPLFIMCQLSRKNSNKDRSGFGHCSIYPSVCLVIFQSNKHLVWSLFAYVQHSTFI